MAEHERTGAPQLGADGDASCGRTGRCGVASEPTRVVVVVKSVTRATGYEAGGAETVSESTDTAVSRETSDGPAMFHAETADPIAGTRAPTFHVKHEFDTPIAREAAQAVHVLQRAAGDVAPPGRAPGS